MKTAVKYIFLFIFFTISLQVYGQYQMPDRGLCAHRGAMDTHPENTIPAFQAAVHAGAQMIELDAQFTKDSVIIIMHDSKVDRTTTGKGRVADIEYEDLKKLSIKAKDGKEYPGLSVPTLEEILSIMPRNVWINCHLKGGDTTLAKEAAQLIQKQGRLHQAFLACDRTSAYIAKEAVPEILICNMEEADRSDHAVYVRNTIEQKDDFLQFRAAVGVVSPELTEQLRRSGMKSNYFRAFEPQELKGLFENGIDFILVNDIVSFMPIAEKLGIKRVKPVF